jgi:hypothetical protein
MAATGQVVSVGTDPTLIFEVIDRITYDDLDYTPTDNPNIFPSRSNNDPLPILLIFPPATDIYLGGSAVTASGAGVGADINGVPSLAYNCVGGDSLYGIVESDSASIQLLVLRQS